MECASIIREEGLRSETCFVCVMFSQVATSLVLCTFLSAPIMYVTARMALVTYSTIDQYHAVIAESQRDVTIVACLCLVRGRRLNPC